MGIRDLFKSFESEQCGIKKFISEKTEEPMSGVRTYLKKSQKYNAKYQNPDGTFKNGFDGAVQYFMHVEGYDEETAKKIAGKIAAEKGEAGGHKKSLAGIRDFAKAKKEVTNPPPAVPHDDDMNVSSDYGAGSGLTKSKGGDGYWFTRKADGKLIHIHAGDGASESNNPYHSYNHNELKDIHSSFKAARTEAKQEISEALHQAAEYLKELHESKHGRDYSIVDHVKKEGGIKTPKRGVHAFSTEYHENVPSHIKRQVGSSHGRPIDEMADELHMSPSELIDRLSRADRVRAKDFYKDAEDIVKDVYGEGELDRKKQDIKELGRHIRLIENAMKKQEKHSA